MGRVSRLRVFYLRILEVLLLLLALTAAVPFITKQLMSPRLLASDDFIEYWAAGRLNMQGRNPYDPALILSLERATGHAFEKPLLMWTPPWSLAPVMPLALLPYPVARTIWFLLALGAFFWCFDRIGREALGSRHRWWSWIAGFTFYPVLDALRTGQISLFSLVGTVGVFVWRDRRPVLAGIMAALLTIKPHVTYLILLALIARAFISLQWDFLLGFSGTLLGSLLLVWISNPSIIHQYLYAWNHHPPVEWATATLGGLLRWYLGPERFTLQFVAPALGLLWFIIYVIRHQRQWVWKEQLPVIAVASSATAAYGWTHDPQPALVGILPVLLQLLVIHRSWATIAFLAFYGLIQCVLFATTFDQVWYFWLGPVLLLWFLTARWYLETRSIHRKGEV